VRKSRRRAVGQEDEDEALAVSEEQMTNKLKISQSECTEPLVLMPEGLWGCPKCGLIIEGGKSKNKLKEEPIWTDGTWMPDERIKRVSGMRRDIFQG
jgi:hypothetical protein